MSILTSYTLRCLKKNRVRTLVTVIGIILSVALFTAVAEGAWSGRQYLIDVTVAKDGAYQGWIDELFEGKAEALREAPELDQVVTLSDLGWAMPPGGSPDHIYPYLRLASMSEDFPELIAVRLQEGRMPENEHELLISDRASASTGAEFRVGQQLRLRVGRRVSSDGEPLGDHNPYLGEEEALADVEERFYTVVGVYHRFSSDVEDYEMPGTLALTVGGQGPEYRAFFTMKHVEDTLDFLARRGGEYGLQTGYNSNLLSYYGSSDNENINAVFFGLAAILFGLIFLGSVALIYNSFSISVSERTKQFGLLKSIGATHRQLRRSVLTEALLLCVAAIPIGLLLGCGGIGLTLRLLQPSFHRIISIEDAQGVSIRLVLFLPALALAAGIGLLTALVSAWIPARRATRLSPIAAIRQSRDVKLRPRELKVSPLTGKLFGFSGTLAAKNFKRSRRKYRTTVISLFLSVVLFISAFSFSDYLRKDLMNSVTKRMADLEIHGINIGSRDSTEQMMTLTERLRGAEHVEEAACADRALIELQIPELSMTQEALSSLSAPENGVFLLSATVYFLPEEDYKALCAKTGADAEAQQAVAYATEQMLLRENGGLVYQLCPLLQNRALPLAVSTDVVLSQPGMVYVGPHYTEDSEYTVIGYEYVSEAEIGPDGSYTTENVIVLSPEEATERKTLIIGGLLEERPLVSEHNSLTLYLPLSAVDALEPDTLILYEELFLRAPEHSAAKQEADEIIRALDLEGSFGQVIDNRTGYESNQAFLLVLNVFTFSFIILISLIAAANVFNTISTNVALRRREFATLRSVGMGNRAFGRMMRFECLLYGAKALLWGLPVSVGISWLIWKVLDQGFRNGGFRPPWLAMSIAAGSVFLVVFATMLYATGKIRKDNPIDALKLETL